MKIHFTFKKPKNIKFLLLDDLSEELVNYLNLNKNQTLLIKYNKRPIYISMVFFFYSFKKFL